MLTLDRNLAPDQISQRDQMAEACLTLSRHDDTSMRQLARGFIEKLVVSKDHVELHLSSLAMLDALIEQAPILSLHKTTMSAEMRHGTIRLIEPIRLCTGRGETTLLLPKGSSQNPKRHLNAALIKGVARAYDWNQKLMTGELRSVSEIADKEKLPTRCVTRLLKMAHLAPDIVEAILDGTQPPDFRIEDLRKRVPMCWQEQRLTFGFID